MSKTAEAVGTTANNLQRWIKDLKQEEGNCWDNAPTERFFSSLKREWLTGNLYPTRENTIADVRAYIAYYNSRRINTTLGDVVPIEFEKCS
ncbi:hypothetical protein BTJ40_04895 [Microbulbifer sp. A4B17]|uniref:IS3 family transposase n=1 Tax=Microbulbifer sp. A4B17 TaxID=359370 RepID=UPI000D52AAFE|nr:hypothetical protein BTJ40_04895 [Microbulbifer sp. A4B17]